VRRPSTPRAVAAIALVLPLVLATCSSDGGSTTGRPESVNTIPPDPTTPVPGTCDPLDLQIPAPTVSIDGVSVDATFGIGTYQCGTVTGDGYIINDFNPILLDAAEPGTVTVKINSDATPKLVLGDDGQFTESGDKEWKSAQPASGCNRLTVTLKSPSGLSRATFGVDIRVGGEGTDCPQRVIDPTDVGAITATTGN